MDDLGAEDRAPPDTSSRFGSTRPWMPASGHRALSERLSGVEEEPAVPRAPVGRPVPRAARSGRGGLIIAILVILALGAGLAAVGALAYQNKTRADDWEARAFRLERNTEQLNGLLIERSTQLSERTEEVNRLAAKVTRQQNALSRSESDVESLSRRQRELAAEKAAVEDSRAELKVQSTALEAVATSFVACKDGLVELLGYVIEQNNAAASQIVDGVAADCSAAESSLAGYRARYG